MKISTTEEPQKLWFLYEYFPTPGLVLPYFLVFETVTLELESECSP